MPGGPHQGEDGAVGAAFPLDAALGAQLAHGDELGDAALDVLQPGVVLVEHLARVLGIQPLLGALRPRHRQQPVEVAADHRRLGRLLALALEPPQLALGLLGDRLRHLGLGDLALVLGDQVFLVLAQLLADRLHLLAQEVLALLLLGARLDVVADLAADLKLGQPLALHLDRELQPGLDVEGLQQLQLLLAREIGAVAGGVGQRAGLLDGAQERADALVGAAQLEDLLDDGAVLPDELVAALVRGVAVVDLLHLDAQLLAVGGLRGAGQPAMQADHGCRPGAVWQLAALDHLGDYADAAELTVLARQQEHAILLPGIDRQGCRDAGKTIASSSGIRRRVIGDPVSVVST